MEGALAWWRRRCRLGRRLRCGRRRPWPAKRLVSRNRTEARCPGVGRIERVVVNDGRVAGEVEGAGKAADVTASNDANGDGVRARQVARRVRGNRHTAAALGPEAAGN